MNRQILTRFREYLDKYPMNTSEAKKLLSKQYNLSLSKINRWYRDPKASINIKDACALVEFFGLVKVEDLFAEEKNKAHRPINGLKTE